MLQEEEIFNIHKNEMPFEKKHRTLHIKQHVGRLWMILTIF